MVLGIVEIKYVRCDMGHLHKTFRDAIACDQHYRDLPDS